MLVKLVIIAILFGIVAVDYISMVPNDEPCRQARGNCNYVRYGCTNGKFVNNLCPAQPDDIK